MDTEVRLRIYVANSFKFLSSSCEIGVGIGKTGQEKQLKLDLQKTTLFKNENTVIIYHVHATL